MQLHLTRDVHGAAHTYGVLAFDRYVFQTIELPWLDNKHGVSCVSIGTYQLFKHDSEAHPKTWALVNPDLGVIHFPDPAHPAFRVACLLHSANWAFQLQGCIGVGVTRGVLQGQPAILRSREALAQIQALVPWTDEHTLTIT